MKDKRFAVGIFGTMLWLVFSAFMFSTETRPDKLEGWGDFFAGFFSPLAFLWLVLGYLQQGKELRQSTEALLLQANELRASVTQQNELVNISREHIEQERFIYEEEKKRRRDTASPRFTLKISIEPPDDEIGMFEIRIRNVGNTASHLHIIFEPPLGTLGYHERDLLAHGEEVNLVFSVIAYTSSSAIIRYRDAGGVSGKARFSLQASPKGSVCFGGID